MERSPRAAFLILLSCFYLAVPDLCLSQTNSLPSPPPSRLSVMRHRQGGVDEAMAAPTQVISLFASESGAILVGTPEGVYLLEGGHKRRRAAVRPQTGAHQQPELRFETFSFYRAAPRRVYAASAHNVYASNDGGAEWREVKAPDSPMPIGALAVAAENPDLIYLSRSNLLWRSADGGQSWERLNNPNRWSINEIVAPSHDRLYVATTGEGVYFSPDRGETWQPRRYCLGSQAANDGSKALPDFKTP